MPLDCPNKLSSSTPFLTLRTQPQDTLRRLGRPTAILGRRWDGLKGKKPLQSLVWDGGTAGTGGGGVCHLPIAALDTKLPHFQTPILIIIVIVIIIGLLGRAR